MIKSCKHCKSANIKHDEYTLWCADCGYILSHNPKLWHKNPLKSEPMKDTINWTCSCGAGFHHYFVNCSECGKENPLDGKGNIIKN